VTQAQWTWRLVPASTWRAAHRIFDTDWVNQQSADTGSQLSHRTCWLGVQGETWHLWAQQAIPRTIPYRLYHNFRDYSCCAVLVEVDSRSHRRAELQEHKPWARPRSRPDLQWAKPVSDPGQTQIRPGSDLNCHNLQCWEANLTQVSYWQVDCSGKLLQLFNLIFNVFWFCKISCQTFSKLLVNRGSFGILNLFKYLIIHQIPNSTWQLAWTKICQATLSCAIKGKWQLWGSQLSTWIQVYKWGDRLQLSQHVAAEMASFIWADRVQLSWQVAADLAAYLTSCNRAFRWQLSWVDILQLSWRIAAELT